MKNLKRNAVVIVVLMFVCAAVYLNWSYNNRQGEAESISKDEQSDISAMDAQYEDTILDKSSKDEGDEDEEMETKEEDIEEKNAMASDYFANARLTRQQSRDEAMGILDQAASVDGASQETIDSAVDSIAAMASNSVLEAQIENLLIAKDFEDCVVFINDDSVTIAVPSPVEGLSETTVMKITDVVTTETSLLTNQMRIVEVKES